jgi:hypothetical protein
MPSVDLAAWGLMCGDPEPERVDWLAITSACRALNAALTADAEACRAEARETGYDPRGGAPPKKVRRRAPYMGREAVWAAPTARRKLTPADEADILASRECHDFVAIRLGVSEAAVTRLRRERGWVGLPKGRRWR